MRSAISLIAVARTRISPRWCVGTRVSSLPSPMSRATRIVVISGRVMRHATAPETFNPVIVDFYREVGYLPDAIVNYLVLLGWAHEDGKSEFFARDEMVKLFSLERVNKGAASFDAKKLFAFQERYMQQLPLAGKVNLALPYLTRAGLISEPVADAERSLVTTIIAEAAHRIVVAGDILDYADFFLPDDRLPYDEKAFEKHIRKAPGPVLLTV